MSSSDPAWTRAEEEYQWFEDVYVTANGSLDDVPWAKGEPNRMLLPWLQNRPDPAAGATALVIGCGLGDDAEALSNAGYQVTAFDISATAVEWAKQRFPDSRVNYLQADLFQLPEAWQCNFDLVFEASTLQALPRQLMRRAQKVIAALKKNDGELLVVAFGRKPEDPLPPEPPWPLSKDEINQFEEFGLRETDSHMVMIERGGRPGPRYRIVYT